MKQYLTTEFRSVENCFTSKNNKKKQFGDAEVQQQHQIVQPSRQSQTYFLQTAEPVKN